MRESRTYGSMRGARDETRVPTATSAFRARRVAASALTTVATWLASSGACNVAENIAGSLSSLMDNGTTGTLVQFIGSVSVTNGQNFTAEHDDGLTLVIGATDLGFPRGRVGGLPPSPTPDRPERSRSNWSTANAVAGRLCFRSICRLLPMFLFPSQAPSSVQNCPA
jgi:hypothetical protein